MNIKVNAFTFARAETDLYFSRLVRKNGGLNNLHHDRTPTPIEQQVVVRMNRDTLYSSSVHDLAAGSVAVTLPNSTDNRFQSLQVISQDHYSPFVIYEGGLELTRQAVGTRYVALVFRTFVNPADADDLKAAHALQDGIRVEQASTGIFEVPQWDKKSQDAARKALAELQTLGGTAEKRRMGRNAGDVDPIAHLLATATGWGLNPREAAIYYTGYPDQNDGTTVHQMLLRDMPVDGFWSISVYNKEGFFEKNACDAYSLNNVTARESADGSIAIQFGGCEEGIQNCLPITEGWNYSLRLYRPRQEVLDGLWIAPEPAPVGQQIDVESWNTRGMPCQSR